MPIPETLQIMAKTVGTALDPRCFDALCLAVERLDAPPPLPIAASELVNFSGMSEKFTSSERRRYCKIKFYNSALMPAALRAAIYP